MMKLYRFVLSTALFFSINAYAQTPDSTSTLSNSSSISKSQVSESKPVKKVSTKLQEKLNAANSELEKVRGASTQLQEKLNAANSELEKVSGASTQLQQKLDDANSKLEKVSGASTQLQQKLDDANSKLEKEREASTQLQQDLSEAQKHWWDWFSWSGFFEIIFGLWALFFAFAFVRKRFFS